MSATAKLAIVTGASSGIGRGIAVALAQEGWDVAFTYLNADSSAEESAAEIAAAGRDVLHCRIDVGIKVEVDRFYDTVAARFGRVPDLLVNNAGIQTWCPLLELSEENWDRVIQTNLKGCFLNTQSVARLLVGERKRGAIVNIGSGCNKTPFPHLVDYSASKGGIEQFTKVAAIELGQYGITVNCVAPGAVEIERTRQEDPDYALTWSGITPLGRVGHPRDVANAVLFLASSKADFVTGQTLWVDGGLFTRPNWPYRNGSGNHGT
jgi:NAD(P)-dependent dehydrogenase (short-subunit alcohol dehydrogenase family)